MWAPILFRSEINTIRGDKRALIVMLHEKSQFLSVCRGVVQCSSVESRVFCLSEWICAKTGFCRENGQNGEILSHFLFFHCAFILDFSEFV